MKKTITRKQIESRLDKMCSICCRKTGFGSDPRFCYTCGKKITYEGAHCCHFVGRSCRPLRWDRMNLKPGCPYCNTYLAGNLARYYKHLKEDGVDADKLLAIEDEWKRGKIRPFKMLELKELHDQWLEEVRKLEKSPGELVPKSWVKLVEPD